MHRWFGLREFLVLTPVSDDVTVTVNEAKMLLSSLCIAAQNMRSSVAVFVPFDRMVSLFFFLFFKKTLRDVLSTLFLHPV